MSGALLLTLAACKPAKPPQAAPPPPAVIVATVTQRTVPLFVEHVGQTEAAETVEIRARVSGFLMEAPFKEGGQVKKGDLLFRIDPKQYQATLDQAKAELLKKESTLARSRADVVRLKPLTEQKAVSQQELDNAEAAVKVAEGDVLGSQAAVTTAELNLGYTEMRAPFDGLIGARNVDVGNFVGNSADTSLLATISTTEPMRVSFNVPESNYLRFQRRFMGNEAAKEQHSARSEFELILSDGSVYSHKGKFDYADRALDNRTGTLKVVVYFPNPEGLLRPGQFSRVRAMPEQRPDAVLVPQRAIVENQSMRSVMVVGEGNKVEQRPVKVSERVGDLYIVDSGLKAGERVIVEGLQKARPGMVVTPKDPEPEEAADKKGAAGAEPESRTVPPAPASAAEAAPPASGPAAAAGGEAKPSSAPAPASAPASPAAKN